jgi:hypothetical protein
LVLIPDARALVTRRGLLRLAVVVVPAGAVNAWFLLPTLVYQSHSVIASWQAFAHAQLEQTMFLVRASHLFTLGRGSAWPVVPHHALGLPMLAAAWILAGLFAARRRWRSPWFVLAVLLLLLTVPVYVVMTNASLLWGLPKPYNNIQFSYRLETYIVLAALGALVATLALLGSAAGRRRRVGAGLLGLVVGFSIVGAAVQLRQKPPSTAPEWKTAGPYLTKDGVPNVTDYDSNDLQPLAFGVNLQVVRFPPASAEKGDRASVTVDAMPGEVVRTNIVTMPQLVHLEGARFLGREGRGQAILELAEDVKPHAAKLTISAAHPWPVALGRILSALGLLGVALNAARLVRRR